MESTDPQDPRNLFGGLHDNEAMEAIDDNSNELEETQSFGDDNGIIVEEQSDENSSSDGSDAAGDGTSAAGNEASNGDAYG